MSTFTFSASKKFQKPVEVIPSSAPTLSLGHWQKLALARSELRQAPLLAILDEPTASLDPRAEQQLFERYSATARSSSGQGTITLLVSHRFSTVRMADLILVLRSGEVAEAGSHEELMAGGGIYARLFQLQAAAYAWPSRWLLPGGWSDAGRNVLLHVDGSPGWSPVRGGPANRSDGMAFGTWSLNDPGRLEVWTFLAVQALPLSAVITVSEVGDAA